MTIKTGVKTSWPWISILLAAAVALVGYDTMRQAFTSGEQLSRTLGQLIVYSALGIAAVVAFIELGIRKFFITRQRRKNIGASGVTHG